LKELHSNLGTIRTIWANWKSVIQIAYIINIWANYNSPNQNWTNWNNFIKYG